MAVVPDFIGRKQNKITIGGVKYKAKEQASCQGCVFGPFPNCNQPTSDDGHSLCSDNRRIDKRSIIWIKKD